MGAPKDLTGQRFGKLTVIKKTSSNPVKWECLCDCGNTSFVATDKLTGERTRSCGCLQKEKTAQTRFKDLTGQTIGRLYVQKLVRKHPPEYQCICSCGNTGTYSAVRLRSVQSCGCLQKNMAGQNKFKDLTGQTFGRLTVLGLAEKTPVKWKCQCSCGNITTVRTKSLTAGETRSCGCIARETAENAKQDLTGNRYGSLVVKQMIWTQGQPTMCECLCDCGKTKRIRAAALKIGGAASCGCRTGIKKEGITKMADCGIPMTITAYRTNTDIDVRFSDGAVQTHRAYGDFTRGLISHPYLRRGRSYKNIHILAKAYVIGKNENIDVYYKVRLPGNQQDILSAAQIVQAARNTKNHYPQIHERR